MFTNPSTMMQTCSSSSSSSSAPTDEALTTSNNNIEIQRDTLRRALNLSLRDILEEATVVANTATGPSTSALASLLGLSTTATAILSQQQQQQQQPAASLSQASSFSPWTSTTAASSFAPLDRPNTLPETTETQVLYQARQALFRQHVLEQKKKRQQEILQAEQEAQKKNLDSPEDVRAEERRLVRESYLAYLRQKHIDVMDTTTTTSSSASPSKTSSFDDAQALAPLALLALQAQQLQQLPSNTHNKVVPTATKKKNNKTTTKTTAEITPSSSSATSVSTPSPRQQEEQVDAAATTDTTATTLNASTTAPPMTLQALGRILRQPSDPYVDVADWSDPEDEDENQMQQDTPSASNTPSGSNKKIRGGVQVPFPERLHKMLTAMDQDNAEGQSHVVSFLSHGRAFMVHDLDTFVRDVLPKFFAQTKWPSFCRQLNLYGFQRIATGPDAGAYYHELCLRGRPNLVRHLRRVGVPCSAAGDRRKSKKAAFANASSSTAAAPVLVVASRRRGRADPDFYAMKPC